MSTELINGHLNVYLRRDLNLLTARKLLLLAEDAHSVYIDMTHARIVDSEGVIALYKLCKTGKKLKLKNAPELLAEIIQVLGLSEVLDLKQLSA